MSNNRQVHERRALSADDTNTDPIGFVGEQHPGKTVRVVAVIAEQTSNADAEWNIQVGGNDLFNSEQSVSSADTPELFAPDQNRYVGNDTDKIEIDKSSAAAAADNLNITVVTEIVE